MIHITLFRKPSSKGTHGLRGWILTLGRALWSYTRRLRGYIGRRGLLRRTQNRNFRKTRTRSTTDWGRKPQSHQGGSSSRLFLGLRLCQGASSVFPFLVLLGPLRAFLPLVLPLLFPFVAFAFVAPSFLRTAGCSGTFRRLVAASFSFLLVVALALSRSTGCGLLVAFLLPTLLCLVSLLPTVVTKDVAEGSS